MGIHPTAIVEAGARIAEDVEIGPFCYVAGTVEIGRGTQLAPHVTLLGHTRLGEGCRVHSGAVIGDLPQDVSYRGGLSYVHIGDRCTLREGVTIHRGTQAESVTHVGHDCLLMAYSHLAHNVHVGNHVTIANNALIAGYAHIGDRVFISGNCLVHQFTRIGRLAMLSGGTAIQKDVPPFCMTRSLSTNTIMGLNVVGLRRAGFSAQERHILKHALDVLYRSALNTSQAVQQLREQLDHPLIQEFCDFISASERGICHFIRRRDSRDPP
ncbi:acyl-ACP--UDP-N-acetylglucosamine O-acyltransferase [Parathermosynechococcus lividus]